MSSQAALAGQVTVVANRMMLDAKKDLIRQAADKAGLALAFADTALPDAALAQKLRDNQFLLVAMPREMDVQAFEQRLEGLGVALAQPVLQTSGGQFSSKNLDPLAAQILGRYYVNGGRSNIDAFFAAVERVLAGQSLEGLPALIEMPEQGVYHPALAQQFTENPDDILKQLQHREGQPVIALGFNVRYLQSNAMAHIDQLIEWVEAAGVFALPVFYSLGPDARLVELLRGRANALIHLQPVYHNGLQEQLDELGIPVLQGIGWWNDSIESWEDSPSGLSLSSTPLYLALPEQNGLIDPLVMWAEQDGELQLIEYQARAAIDKAIRLAALQTKPLAEQKIAVMVYNYPPGEQNLSASFMNVPRSLALLSQQWLAQGYRTRAFSEQELIDGLGGAIEATHNPKGGVEGASQSSISLADYQAWFEQLPAAVQARINDYWGEPGQSPMLTSIDGQPAFRIPHLDAGHMVYLGQPSRGRPGEDNERALYHDMRVPINHYYLATYLWLRDVFGADALVHFGTHGTQEWMPGKERGLSIYDDSLLILGDTPVVYPYIIDDVGEAVQAKRRGRAVMISHQTPPFRPSGLHGKLVDLHQLIHQWETLEPGAVRDNTVERLLELSAQDELTTDLGWTVAQANARPADFIQALHDYLHQLAAQSQPIGLHTYADNAQVQRKLTTVLQMLGGDFIAAFDLAEPQELFVEDYQSLALTPPYRWLETLLVAKEAVTPELAQWQSLARTYYASLDTAGEWRSLDAALRGRHVEPGIGGDPIRVPDSLPSGKNLVGFDPA
ncbi:MAG: cobaltochelatase subunit CobN, partial [Halioglobus sp.]|nr:cobaltochelatase subunit CobN [Halioglobus sp.]